MQLRSLETPDEHRQLAERRAEFAGRRLLLQQDRPYRGELLVAGEALVVSGNRAEVREHLQRQTLNQRTD